MQSVLILCLLGVAQAGTHLRLHKERLGNLPGDATKLGLASASARSKEAPEIVREIQDSTVHPEDYNHEVVDGVDYEELPAKTFDTEEEAEKSVDKDEADWDNEVQQEVLDEEKETGEQEGPGIVWTSAVEETWPGEDEQTKKKWDTVLHAEIANMEKTGNPFTPTREFADEIEAAEKRGELNGDGKQPDQESLQNFTRELEAEVAAANSSSSPASAAEPATIEVGGDDVEGDTQVNTKKDDVEEETDVGLSIGDSESQTIDTGNPIEDGPVLTEGSENEAVDDDLMKDDRNAEAGVDEDVMPIEEDNYNSMVIDGDGADDRIQALGSAQSELQITDRPLEGTTSRLAALTESLQNSTHELEAEVASPASGDEFATVGVGEDDVGEDMQAGTKKKDVGEPHLLPAAALTPQKKHVKEDVEDKPDEANNGVEEETHMDLGSRDSQSQIIDSRIPSEDDAVQLDGSDNGEVDDDLMSDGSNAEVDVDEDGMPTEEDQWRMDSMVMDADGADDSAQGIENQEAVDHESHGHMMI
jgi:hypothetical protein